MQKEKLCKDDVRTGCIRVKRGYNSRTHWSFKQTLSSGMYFAYIYIYIYIYISLPATQHLTPTTPKPFLLSATLNLYGFIIWYFALSRNHWVSCIVVGHDKTHIKVRFSNNFPSFLLWVSLYLAEDSLFCVLRSIIVGEVFRVFLDQHHHRPQQQCNSDFLQQSSPAVWLETILTCWLQSLLSLVRSVQHSTLVIKKAKNQEMRKIRFNNFNYDQKCWNHQPINSRGSDFCWVCTSVPAWLRSCSWDAARIGQLDKAGLLPFYPRPTFQELDNKLPFSKGILPQETFLCKLKSWENYFTGHFYYSLPTLGHCFFLNGKIFN